MVQYSILQKSKLDSIALRLDPEYYYPSYLYMNKKLMEIDHVKIKDIAFVTDGIHESINFDENSKIILVSAKAPKENYFDVSGLKTISNEQNEKNPRTQLLENDIIISSVGTIGNCAVVNKRMLPANSDRHVGIIRLNNKKYQPRFISTFLLSKYGRFQSLRESTGNVQLNLFVYKINELIIPNLSSTFQKYIEETCQEADKKTEMSVSVYIQAQTLLLAELGLANWQPKHQLTFVRNYSDTEHSARIDAEYFQPKYEEIVDSIKSYSGGWDMLGDLVNLKATNFTPIKKQQYKYIELANITGNGEISTCMIEEGQDLPSRARRKVSKGDIIVSSIEGSLSSIAMIEKEYHQALCSTGFHVISSKIFNSETLLVLMKSITIQLQLKKGCSGTILTAINKDEFSKVVLPIIAKETQTKIQQKITESFALRKQAKHLLECAKQAVELAIEQDEKTAITWLEKEIEKI